MHNTSGLLTTQLNRMVVHSCKFAPYHSIDLLVNSKLTSETLILALADDSMKELQNYRSMCKG